VYSFSYECRDSHVLGTGFVKREDTLLVCVGSMSRSLHLWFFEGLWKKQQQQLSCGCCCCCITSVADLLLFICCSSSRSWRHCCLRYSSPSIDFLWSLSLSLSFELWKITPVLKLFLLLFALFSLLPIARSLDATIRIILPQQQEADRVVARPHVLQAF
jgi:hypothetical protein